MGFCFTYEPKDSYVDSVLSWTKQTKKKNVLPPKINSGKKSQCVM